MKITNLILMAGAAITLAACGGPEAGEEEMEIVMSTATVDTESSTLAWKGMKSADYFHTGTVKFTEGTAEFIDGNMTSGNFIVDLSSMSVTDELPDEKKGMLVGHLSSPDFFNLEQNASVSVSAGAYMDGTLPITINISGVKISQDVPVKVEYTDGKGSITGNFDVDFSSLDVKGLKPNPEKPGEPSVSPIINFDINLMLK